MSAASPVTYSAAADGVGWITFDDPDARVNVFNSATQDAFGAALDSAAADVASGRVKALVVTSGKERIFIAGADLKWLGTLPDAATATEFSRRGQGLFQRLAESPVPVVCAIHGACAGGGYELALACHWRIASDAPVTQIGLPETGIGTIPGWGGCVRLPRLIGLKPALDHILRAQLVGAQAALESGLVQEVAPAAELRARAHQAALRLAAEGRPLVPPRPAMPRDAIAQLREQVQHRSRGQQPALLAALDAAVEAAERSLPEAFEIEARHFGAVTAGATCKNLIRVFFLRDAARKPSLEPWFAEREAREPTSPAVADKRSSEPPLRCVGVVGAGVMGSGIAQWLAVRGFDVVLRDVDAAAVERGIGVIRALCDEAVQRGKLSGGGANRALHRITGTAGWEGFEQCDAVIEAVVENLGTKQALFRELAGVVRSEAMLASNTSALPIEAIAAHTRHPERVLGIHFFNPVSRMPLVELVLSPQTSRRTAAQGLAFVQALGKSPVICRSSPGFLVTRVLFFFLNEAVRRWESGAGTAELDEALRDFGWPMGPLRLIDEVGIDVTDFIFGELEHYFPQRFVRSQACGRLLAAGLRGRKNGASRGFYRYDGGEAQVNDVETRPLVGVVTPAEGGRSGRGGAEGLMQVMVEEARRCLEEGVVKTADDIDFALLSGTGFPPFRGGLMHWARSAGILQTE